PFGFDLPASREAQPRRVCHSVPPLLLLISPLLYPLSGCFTISARDFFLSRVSSSGLEKSKLICRTALFFVTIEKSIFPASFNRSLSI
ncbi:MAG: hypothetical protein K5707_05625, partial [Clostridia bacterium]|nr:hypothetical protein [Clostridia bacterium]